MEGEWESTFIFSATSTLKVSAMYTVYMCIYIYIYIYVCHILSY